MIGIVDLQRAETDLAAGELDCPGCGGVLRRWGHARAREIRDSGPGTLRLRPRRARCSCCGATHVLLLAAVLPRRADTTAVIGTALQGSARGIGYRRIATQLERPASTVRRWIRALRDHHHIEWLREQAIQWIARVDRDVLATLTAQSTRLGEALTALAAAALTVRARLTPHVPPWTLIGQFTRGRLITRPAPADISLLRGPRAPTNRRHRADAGTRDAPLPGGTAPISAPPRRPKCRNRICISSDAYIGTLSGGQQLGPLTLLTARVSMHS